MSRRKIYGICHICGQNRELSFEHLPPKKAFNNHSLHIANSSDILRHLNKKDFEDIKGKISKRGFGDYTLCNKCNNDTGAWYGNAYISWAYQAAAFLISTKGMPLQYYPYKIFPLRVIKQIICMFLSANGPDFRIKYPELEYFVLNKNRKYLTPSLRIFCYYNPGKVVRKSGIVTLIGATGSLTVLSEISYFPFGYIMYFNDCILPERFIDISFFSRYNYDDFKVVPLKIPSYEIYSWYPGDFRKREQFVKT